MLMNEFNCAQYLTKTNRNMLMFARSLGRTGSGSLLQYAVALLLETPPIAGHQRWGSGTDRPGQAAFTHRDTSIHGSSVYITVLLLPLLSLLLTKLLTVVTAATLA